MNGDRERWLHDVTRTGDGRRGDGGPDRDRLVRLWVGCGVALLLFGLTGFLLLSSTGHDDSHITYWAAYSLASFGEILNYNGERIEQSSSLLHVLLLGLIWRISSADIATIGGLFSFFCGVASIAAAALVAWWLGLRASWLAPLTLASSPLYLYWSMSGMETTLASLCLLAAGVSITQLLEGPLGGRRFAIALGGPILVLLVRPEAPFVLAAAMSAVFVAVSWLRFLGRGPESAGFRRRLVGLAVVIGVVALALIGWRLATFGAAFPNPVEAKVSGLSLSGARTGLRYLARGLANLSLLLPMVVSLIGVFAAISGRLASRQAIAAVTLASFVAAQFAFTILSGGDWMWQARFLVVVAPLTAVLTAIAIERMARHSGWLPAVATVAILAVGTWDMATLLPGRSAGYDGSTGIPFALARGAADSFLRSKGIEPARYSWFDRSNLIHLRDIPVAEAVDRLVTQLRARGRKPVSVMSIQMGLVAERVSKRHYPAVRWIDLRGITSDGFSRCPAAADLERSALGHLVWYRHLFRDRPELFAACGIARPDVLFDLFVAGSNAEEVQRVGLVESGGYSVVYRQQGWLRLKGANPVLLDQFVAVREDLESLLDERSVSGAPESSVADRIRWHRPR